MFAGSAAIHFNMINPETGNRIKMVTQDSETGKPLERRDLVKGYEFKKDHYLILTDEDFDSVKGRDIVHDGRGEVRRH